MLADIILAAACLFILCDGHEWVAKQYVTTLKTLRHP
ncbi:MAG: hypothetical protein AWU57_177 [Marinobacter sp. T13-3]|nr:MAG: hypothetical protein AWU57_177 [Marinobacter sp. T13-3]